MRRLCGGAVLLAVAFVVPTLADTLWLGNDTVGNVFQTTTSVLS